MARISAIAFTHENKDSVSVKYREIKIQYDELLFDLTRAVYTRTANFLVRNGFDAETREYMCRSLNRLKKLIQTDYSGREFSLALITDMPEEHAKILLEKFPIYGDEFVEEAIRIGAPETAKQH